ncbi:hypothetical protein HYX70_00250 [Candidatus Saccharibacteria bacterium]|nr:hypothetical protein [Candidatus Saccharibacteria bacterium]
MPIEATKQDWESTVGFITMGGVKVSGAIGNIHVARERIAAVAGVDADGLEDLGEVEDTLRELEQKIEKLKTMFVGQAESLPA